MSELGPITAELRNACGDANDMVSYAAIESHDFERLCDAIDAVHAGLERENAELRQRVVVLDESADSMHDGGSITDELRGWYKDRMFMGNGWQELDNIADRIDAEHEEAIQQVLMNEGCVPATDADLAEHGLCRIGSAAMWDEVRDMKDRELSEEHGLVRLPVDAEGKPICIGDEVEWCDSGETLTVEGIGRDVLFYIDGENAEWTAARNKRHHHAPTVEDVLREMADRCYADEDEPRDRDAIVAEFAKRLTLAGDAS